MPSIITTRSQKQVYVNKSISESFEIDKTITKGLENQIKKLNKQNRSLKKQIINLEAKCNSLKLPLETNNNIKQTLNEDKWLDDLYIDSFFNSLTTEISKSYSASGILFVNPSITHLIKNGTNYEILSTLTSLNYNEMDFVFFCLNDFNENLKDENSYHKFHRGSHWSLVVFNKKANLFEHYDSISGLNIKNARSFCSKINPDCEILEMKVLQQSNSFECAIHVMVNTRLVLNRILISNTNSLQLDRPSTENNLQSLSTEVNETKTAVTGTDRTLMIMAQTELINDTNSASNKTVQSNIKTYENDELILNSNNLEEIIDLSNNQGDYAKPRFYNTTFYKFKNKDNFCLNCQNRFQVLRDLNDLEINEESVQQFNLKNTMNTLNIKTSVNDVLFKNRKLNGKNHKKKTLKTSNISSNLFKKVIDKSSPLNNYATTNNFEKKITLKKLTILSDSHGRGLASKLSNKMDDFDVSSFVYPGASLEFLISKIHLVNKSMTMDDILLIIGGTNDISNNPQVDFKPIIDSCLNLSNSKVMLLEIPYRFDLKGYNNTIRKVNKYIKDVIVCSENHNHSHVSLNMICRKDYSKQGLHFNNIGKNRVCSIISEHIYRRIYSSKDPNDYSNTMVPSTEKIPMTTSNHTFDNLKTVGTDKMIQSFPIPVIYNRMDRHFLDRTSRQKKIT